jgi:inosose dehydratase
MPETRFAHHHNPWALSEMDEALGDIAEAGFKGVEGFPNLFPLYADKTELAKRELDHRQLTLVAMEGHGSFIHPDTTYRVIQENACLAKFAGALGASHLVVTVGPRDQLQSVKQDFAIAAHTLNELARRCLEYEITLCFLPQLGTRVEREDEIDRILNLVDTRDVSLCLDTGHLYQAVEDPVRIFSIYGECLKHVRFRDLTEETDDPERQLYCELGDGVIDFKPIQRVLSGYSYSGWITACLEEETQYEKKKSAERSLSFLRAWQHGK